MASDQREAALKPCPFCGHETVEILGRGDVHWGRCDAIDCGTAGPIRHVEADAIAAWNRRAHAPPTEAEVLAVTATLESALLSGGRKRSLYEVVTAALNAYHAGRSQ